MTIEDRRRVIIFTMSGLALLALGLFFGMRRSPPQMGADREVFTTVDALFTAVTGKDEKRLSDCEQRLRALRETGKLPPDAAAALATIGDQARSGSWQTAAERLYEFMRAQRRVSGP